ncbi:MAG: hypothetical protein WC208_16080 [Gallionella sp.]|jgi:hypothetical protein
MKDLPFSKKKQLNLATRTPSIKNLDDLTREVVRLRDKVCQRSGVTKDQAKLEVSHFISRANKHTRWDLDNVCLLSFREHYVWGHQNPNEFHEWWLKRLGEAKFNALMLRSKDTSKVDRSLIKLYLLQQLAIYKGEA